MAYTFSSVAIIYIRGVPAVAGAVRHQRVGDSAIDTSICWETADYCTRYDTVV